MSPGVHVIIVTHNSQEVIATCIDGVKSQIVPALTITIVDSGSTEKDYLLEIEDKVNNVILLKNVGFSRANNIGLRSLKLHPDEIVIFLNPDAFLQEDAISWLVDSIKERPAIGAIGGKLLHYNLEKEEGTKQLDSTGIFRKWYGRWYDRGQGEDDRGQYDLEQYVPGICGALFCCRVRALQSLDSFGFNERFFMYKEDIELSLRLRGKSWQLLYNPKVIAYHCRGWSNSRSDVSYDMRLMSARNEVTLYILHPSIYFLWAILKYISVRFFRI